MICSSIYLKAAYERLIDKKIKQSEQYKAFYDKKHKNVEFKIDDLVSVYWPTPVKGMSKKFLSSWRGPYKIKQRLGQVTYRVEKGTLPLPVHVQRHRLYVPFELTDLELRR